MNTHVNTELLWSRCKRVEIEGGTLSWELNQTRYSTMTAYQEGPHRELMAANSDDALRVFVRKWGPLRQAPGSRDSLSWYHQKRDLLTATVRLVAALQRRSTMRSALLNLIQTSEDGDPLNIFFRIRRTQLRIPPDLKGWCEHAPESQIEMVCVQFVHDFPFSCVPRFVVTKHGRDYAVRASLFINNLLEVLWWMVWEDVFREEPFSFCRNCGAFIMREGKRVWKFCGPACAKLKADSDSWRRRCGKNLRYRKGIHERI